MNLFASTPLASEARQLTDAYEARRKAALPQLGAALKAYARSRILKRAGDGRGDCVLRFHRLTTERLTEDPQLQRLFRDGFNAAEVEHLTQEMLTWAEQQGLQHEPLNERNPQKVLVRW